MHAEDLIKSWASLLDNEEDKVRNDTYHWWPELFSMLILPEDDLAPEQEKPFLENLDQFLYSSKYGEFHAKLDLLEAFRQHLRVLQRQQHKR